MDTSKKTKCKLLVILPVGPDDNGRDTIESIFAYCTKSVIILAIDDSKNDTTKSYLENVDSRVIRLGSKGYPGIRGGLFCNIAAAYEYAVKHYSFEIVLRIDTDALITGEQPEADALRMFKTNKSIGMLGSYRYGYDGKKRNFKIVAKGMMKETSLLGLRNNPRRKRLNSWINVARQYGYETGEHCLGAAIFLRNDVAQKLYSDGDLSVDEFHDSVISEDHLFSLMTYAKGYKLGDFMTGDLPMGVKWRGLPDSPTNLLKRGKKIVHSIKFYENLDEKAIRDYFRKARQLDSSN